MYIAAIDLMKMLTENYFTRRVIIINRLFSRNFAKQVKVIFITKTS